VVAKIATKTWLALAAGLLLGALVGGVLALMLWGLPSTPTPLRPIALPTEKVESAQDPGAPRLSGTAHTTVKDFELKDLQDVRVLHLEELKATLDLAALNRHLIRMTHGQVRGVNLVIRRGNSGRVSLAEAFGTDPSEQAGKGKDDAPKTAPNLLQIGPLQVRNAQIRVALTDRPLVFHVDQATVRVQRTRADTAPKIFLSNLHGHMVEPDPLPQPVRIRGGSGVIDLAKDPLVDLRTRVCVGGAELRVHIELEKQRRPVLMRAEAEGLAARAALLALGIVSRIKDDKLSVSKGPVGIEEPWECTRAEGREKREALR
jgi:hypothetical protein